MKALIVFGSDNDHPFASLLDSEHRHVWCILPDETSGSWVSYNWHQGVPLVRVEGPLDFDIAEHYRSSYWHVVEYDYEPDAVSTPFILNNCVGHVKSVLGICSWSLTPRQLFDHVTGKSKPSRINFMKKLFTIPGFGGGSAPTPPPPPPPPEPVAKKADKDVQTARRDEMKQARLAAGQSGTVKTSLGDTSATTTSTLLGS